MLFNVLLILLGHDCVVSSGGKKKKKMAQSENDEKEELVKDLFKMDLRQLIVKFRRINRMYETTATSREADEAKQAMKEIVESLNCSDDSEMTQFDVLLLKAFVFMAKDIKKRSSADESDTTSSEHSAQSGGRSPIQTARRGRWQYTRSSRRHSLLTERSDLKSEWPGMNSNENGTK